MTSPQTPAGWYPDPSGSTHQRYWDGAQWTDHYAAPAPYAHVAPGPQGPLAPAPDLWWAAPVLAVLALIGAAGTWVTASFAGSEVGSVTGLEGGDGYFTLVTAIIAIVLLVVWRQAGHRWAAILAGALATLGTLIPLIYVLDPSAGIDGVGEVADFGRGWGLWLAFLGSGALAALSFVLSSRARRG